MLERAVPVISVIGWGGTGKTTVIERLIPALKQQGIERIAAIKHTHHTGLDKPGKDTDRLRHAGAASVGLIGPEGWALFCYDESKGLDKLLALTEALGPFDLILIEGLKQGPWPKIEVVREAVNAEFVSPPEELVAVVSDLPPRYEVPWVNFGEEDRLAEAVVAWWRSQQEGEKA